MRSLITRIVAKWKSRKPSRRELDRLMIASLSNRLNILERNQNAIVKRLITAETALKNIPRSTNFTAKAIETNADDKNKGLNGNKPTIH